MPTQYTAKKHHTAVLAAKQTESGLQRVDSDASSTTQKDLSTTVHTATERRELAEDAFDAMKKANVEAKARRTSLKFAIAAVVAYGNSTGEPSLTEAGQRTAASDIAVGEVLLDQLSQLKGTTPQALFGFMGKQLEACRDGDARAAKAQEAAAKADLAWSTEYFRLLSLTSLGISLQQAAGFEVVRTKNPPRGKAKKKVTTQPEAPVAIESDPGQAA